jgi:hypothetical protein
MKFPRSIPVIALSAFASSLLIASPQHGQEPVAQPAAAQPPATISIRQNDVALCGTPFFDSLYALTVEVFSVGAAQVVEVDFREQVFALVRASAEFGGNAEAFVEHIKDIPGQLVQIIREDGTVLDSCDNFSIALIGPP